MMTTQRMIGPRRLLAAALAAGIGVAMMTAPAFADPPWDHGGWHQDHGDHDHWDGDGWHHDRGDHGHWDRDGWRHRWHHDHDWRRNYAYAPPPPVYYAPPPPPAYYAPPPVYFGPPVVSFGFNIPFNH